MRVEIRIHGLQEVQRALAQLPQEIREEALERTLRAAAESILEAARARAPVRTGRLRQSLAVGQVAKDAKASKGAGVFIGSTSPHAHFQEFGTAHHPPKRFMRPAFDARADAARRIIEAGLLQELNQAVARARAKAGRK
jgi:HK97 gp10 family phage protein